MFFFNSLVYVCIYVAPWSCEAQRFIYVQCFLQAVYGLNAYEGMKTTNSSHLSERYSAEFKQTIEIKEHSPPETVFATFEFFGVCNLMQNTAQ